MSYYFIKKKLAREKNMHIPFLQLSDCLACSRLPLAYNLVGLLIPLCGRGWFYLSLMAIAAEAVALALGLGIYFLAGLLHFGIGLSAGLVLALIFRVQLTPKSVSTHHHSHMWFCGELLTVILPYAYVDSINPDTGFNYGIWLSFVLLLVWWGILFFSNYHRVESTETARYERNFLFLLVAVICFHFPYLFHTVSHYITGPVGCVLTLLFGSLLHKSL